MSDKASGNALDGLIAALPELYQPIFGHPEHSATVSRQCHDRFEHIARAYKALEAQLQRPLRVLDLGCAQGFFSLSLAELGATVHGVDYLDTNVAVCNALAAEHPELKTSFQVTRIEEEILERLQPDQYDLVLGLSVFHHIVYEKGAQAVSQMLGDLTDKVAGGIFELALASEPLYWAAAQPQEPRQLLNGFAFVHELAQHQTHLSCILRPLYFASNRYWCLKDQIGVFDSWQAYSHVLAQDVHQGTRRYYFGGGLVVKLLRLDHTVLSTPNLEEYRNEVAFLRAPPPGFKVPRLVQEGQHEREAWLVRTQLPGELLVDIIHAGRSYDAAQVLRDVLAQLATLEAVGLYHSDVRTWNVLISPDGHATLIDYGAITNDGRDCVWPRDIFLAFMIFVYEVTTGRVENPNPLRTVTISPYRLDQPYRKWMMAFWSHLTPQWSFKLMHQLFMQMDILKEDNELAESSPLRHWMQAVEDAMEMQVSATRHVQWHQQQIEKYSQEMLSKLIDTQAHAEWLQNEWNAAKQRVEEFSQRTGRLEGELDSERQRTVQLGAELQAAREHESHLQAHAQWLQNEWDAAKVKVDELNHSPHHWWTVADGLNHRLQDVYNTKSWRITAPLRWMDAVFHKDRKPPQTAKEKAERILKPLLAHGVFYVNERPRLECAVLAALAPFPALKARLRRMAGVGSPSVPVTASPVPVPDSAGQLSPRARQVYRDLMQARTQYALRQPWE